ncbi:RING-H2 finger protein ATL66-like [Diospyros lotus]|uniref:RING-H2 finger protein ATL66-like n=1 Tax=Diospyros lotus TaxID=55363 RepID=UPI002252249A|nr:RING-H2 finger protein ATL66-like [Diospyros lotus]
MAESIATFPFRSYRLPHALWMRVAYVFPSPNCNLLDQSLFRLHKPLQQLLVPDIQPRPHRRQNSALMSSQESNSFHWHYAEFDDRNFEIGGRTLFSLIVLLAVVLLITLLFIYTRWVFRSRSVHAPPSHAAQPQGLDRSAIERFPVVLHQSSVAKTVDESECSICLGVFEDGDKVMVLPRCRHCYHSECVDKWLTSQPSCPLCRSSLRSDSPV